MIELVGSEKQRKWATSIIQDFTKVYPRKALPDVSSADWWIVHRDSNLEELLADAKDVPISTPFTSLFPRYNRQDAIAAVKALGNDYAVLDLESTGLKRNVDEVTEIAILRADGSVLLNSLIRPLNTDQAVKAAIKGISKIELEDLEHAPTFDAIAPQITAILEKYHLVIYNANFDAPFLAYQYLRYGLEVPTIRATCCMRLASAYFNTDTNISLENVCKMLHVQQVEPAHRAISDCMSTIGILKAMSPRPEPVVNSRLIQLRARLSQERSLSR